PYVVSESTQSNKIIVVVNKNHPYWSTQLSGTESVRDYLRQCVYDAVAEWQARAKASTIDTNTVKLLKDHLLRVSLQMESHADADKTAPAPAQATTVHESSERITTREQMLQRFASSATAERACKMGVLCVLCGLGCDAAGAVPASSAIAASNFRRCPSKTPM